MRRLFKPLITRPADFDDFWSGTLQELEGLSLDLTERTLPKADSDPELELKTLSFASLGGVTVHGYLLRWRGAESRPLVVHSHGYGSQTEVMWPWARAGLHVLGVDIRGFGESRAALRSPSRWGYMLTGIDAPEHHFLSTQRLVLHGISFAGGLALMAESILQKADLLAVGVPTFGWAEGRRFFVKAGSGKEINDYAEARPDHVEDLMVVLRYFDAVNFAERITCPTLVGLGIVDDVVPANTVYAIANHLAGPHEIMEFPISHSESPEEQHWEQFEHYWMKIAREGFPEGFSSEEGRKIHDFDRDRR